MRSRAFLGSGLILLASACEPSFDPDWRPAQSLELIDAGWDPPAAAQDASSDAGVDAASDGAIVQPEAGPIYLPLIDCSFWCTDAGPSCNPVCIAACKDVPCTQGVPCLTGGMCITDCTLCMVPTIK